MKIPLAALVVLAMTLTACGWRDSQVNPTNWFGNPEPVAAAPAQDVNPLIPETRDSLLRRPDAPDTSVLIATVSSLQINPSPSGAIVLVEGIASRQGAYDAELIPTGVEPISEDGVLELEFRVVYPTADTPVGSARSREVIEAFSLSRQDLNRVRVVRVRGAEQALESRRR